MNRNKAEEIRRLSASGMPWDELAAKFGAVRETVRGIVRGETWHGRPRRHRE
jgi:predicted transcriptional regulator